MGEELNQLMRSDYHVFHDVTNAPYGNIDHVLVGPTGVYAVETKTRRKREEPGREAHVVIFDGSALHFPHGGGGAAERKCLEQARHQASRLSDLLSKAVGEPVAVQRCSRAGWLVERKGRGAVMVIIARR